MADVKFSNIDELSDGLNHQVKIMAGKANGETGQCKNCAGFLIYEEKIIIN